MPTSGTFADCGWKTRGLWAIDTVNANSWASLDSLVLTETAADVVLIQEHKNAPADATQQIAARGRSRGWRCTASAAHRIEAGRGSGGCGVAVRLGLGVSPHDFVQEGFRHRIHFAWFSGIVRGGIHCGSIWLHDSQGVSEANLLLPDQAAATLSLLQGPWLIGGDWNITPEQLQATSWLGLVDGVIFAPTHPTCHGDVYDFVVVARGLAHAVAGISRIEGAVLHPHWPSRFLLRGDARRQLVRRLVKPRPVPALLPHGPLPRPQELPSAVSSGDVGIDAAVLDRSAAADREWASLECHEEGGRASVHSFRWERAAGPVARAQGGAAAASCLWRRVATRFEECAGG